MIEVGWSSDVSRELCLFSGVLAREGSLAANGCGGVACETGRVWRGTEEREGSSEKYMGRKDSLPLDHTYNNIVSGSEIYTLYTEKGLRSFVLMFVILQTLYPIYMLRS